MNYSKIIKTLTTSECMNFSEASEINSRFLELLNEAHKRIYDLNRFFNTYSYNIDIKIETDHLMDRAHISFDIEAADGLIKFLEYIQRRLTDLQRERDILDNTLKHDYLKK